MFKLQALENQITTFSNFLESNNPLAVLRRGYAKVYLDTKEVTSIDEIKVNDSLDIKLYNGSIKVAVSSVEKTTT